MADERDHFRALPITMLCIATAYCVLWEAMAFSCFYSDFCFNGYMIALSHAARWTIWIYAIAEVFRTKDRKRAAVYVLIMVLFSLTSFDSLGMMGAMIVAFAGRPVKKLLPCWFIPQILVLIASWAGTLLGLVPYEVRSTGGRNLGTTWNTDGSAFWLFAYIAFVIYRRGKIKLYEYPITGFIAYYLYTVYKARNNMICFLMLFVLCICYTLYEDYLGEGKIKEVLRKIFAILRRFVFDYVFIYGAALTGILLLNEERLIRLAERYGTILITFRDRVTMTNVALKANPITVFGQKILDENAKTESADYFFVDMGYVRLLIMGGIIAFIVIMIMTIYIQKKAAKYAYWAIYISMIVLAWYFVIDYHYVHFYYCAIPALILADWSYFDPSMHTMIE